MTDPQTLIREARWLQRDIDAERFKRLRMDYTLRLARRRFAWRALSTGLAVFVAVATWGMQA